MFVHALRSTSECLSSRCVLVPAVALLTAAAAYGQAAPELKIERSSVTGLASFVTSRDGAAIPVVPAAGAVRISPEDFLGQHGHLFGVTSVASQLVRTDAQTDALGHTHATFAQRHKGLNVFGGVLKVHQDAAGLVYAANGDFFPEAAKVDATPRIGVADAARIADEAIASGEPTVTRSELVIVNPAWYGDPDIGVHLAHYLILSDLSADVREAFFVNAHNGEILDRWTLIHTAKVREIHDAAGTPDLPGPLARTEGEPANGDPDVDSAYDYYGDVYDYYLRAFGRDSIDDAGMTMIATVNSTAPNCANAFWNGEQMVFCTGTVTDDVVGHELTHGVTEFTANLIYQNQSGQLNESYSDVFGEMIDLFNGNAAFAGPPGGTPWPVHPTGSGLDTPNHLRTSCSPEPDYTDGVRWLLAEDAAAFGGAIRDMWDPTCEGDPDYANSPLQTCSLNDNGGVHSGSGVPNHAFAIATDGKVFNGYTVTGIGPIKAGAVWYRALTTYLTIASDFADAYSTLNQAATDLIGTFPNDPRTGAASASMFTAANAQEVNEALLAVEMNTAGACGQGSHVLLSPEPVALCPNRTTIYANDFENAAAGWTVSNTNPPTAYDWVLSGDLPFLRPGTAWFVDDPNIGDCGAQDELGVHSLFSPVINVPMNDGAVFMSFTHYASLEASWDGGNVKCRIDGGDWTVIPRNAFQFNPYNGKLRSAEQNNSNPIAGELAWTGAGGDYWGTSIINLSGLVSGGETLQLRFDMGKDGCVGYGGWYVDDVEIAVCPDCDGDATTDANEFRFAAASEPLTEIGVDSPVTFSLASPPPASGDVALAFTAFADLSSTMEYLDVAMNGTPIGTIYQFGSSDCSAIPDSNATLTVPAATYNTALAGGDLDVTFTATPQVNPVACAGSSYITVFIEYDVGATDMNANAVPDECECFGELTGDSEVNALDLAFLLGNWGPNAGSPADFNADALVNSADLALLLGNWGRCD